MKTNNVPELVLASASQARRAILENAGIAHSVRPARVDEDELKRALTASPIKGRDLADALAEAKAIKISARDPEALVLGADQVLVCNDIFFDKPIDMDHARAHLAGLSGKQHQLCGALVLAQGGEAIWRHVAIAKMHMRPLSQEGIDAYLAVAGPDILSSVGAYQLEGVGAQLFERIDGDYFTVMGLPLLPLLQQLRLRDMVLP